MGKRVERISCLTNRDVVTIIKLSIATSSKKGVGRCGKKDGVNLHFGKTSDLC